MPLHAIVPAHLAVQAMRDSGYKNAAYALAELMDNSVQAEAEHVELLCAERDVQLEHQRRWRIHQVAVLDDGTGMDAITLRMALQFGNGTHLDTANQTGIGRFGMGLPNSSISQCTRVDVWSWQNGVASALHAYLDLDEIKAQTQTEIPEPQPRAIPDVWRKAGNVFGTSGTLVVWSNIDRCVWRTGKAIIDNSEFLIGRMYRRFLEDDAVSIRMVAFDFDNPTSVTTEEYARPNDPGYLMARTSCPPPFDQTPMFQAFNEDEERTFTIEFQGKRHEVKVRFSVAKEEARTGTNPGILDHGQHARKNVGVSLVRAGRELELDQTFVIQYDPVERWWGVEVEFPPSLDELFGVSNNKQSARNFTELARIDLKSAGQTITELKEELREQEDPRGPLLEIGLLINNHLSTMRRWLTAQTKGSRGTTRHQEHHSAEQVATDATRARQQEGYKGRSDAEEVSLPADERRGIIEETLIEEGVMESTAKELAARTVSDGLKYVFAKADLETSAFFSVKIRAGALVVSLNTSHPAYDKLVDVLEEDVEGVSTEKLQDRLTNAAEGLKLLLTAWARYEDEQPEGALRIRAQEARNDWGRIARQFLEREE